MTIAALDTINAMASTGLDIPRKPQQLRVIVGKAKLSAGAAVPRTLDALEQKLQ